MFGTHCSEVFTQVFTGSGLVKRIPEISAICAPTFDSVVRCFVDDLCDRDTRRYLGVARFHLKQAIDEMLKAHRNEQSMATPQREPMPKGYRPPWEDLPPSPSPRAPRGDGDA